MRSRQALKNIIGNLGLQVVVLLSGFILPRFFLEGYGSTVNGMITSINQFLAYLSLAEAGVSTASVVALYKPLADQDKGEINCVLSATRQFYNRSGILFTGLVSVLVVVYPFFLSKQINSTLVRSMIVVLGASIVVDYFLIGKYRVLLMAHQKGYIVSMIQAFGTICNMGVSIVLIYWGSNVLLVKGVATGIYMLRFFIVRSYVKKFYPDVSFQAEPHYAALHQRGAALLHQVVSVIVNNTDVVVLTICLGNSSLKEISVYGIYSMVASAVNTLLSSFSNALASGFGEVISKGENDVLEKSFSNYEYVYMIFIYIITACTWILILPFVCIYTKNVTDVNYVRPLIGILFALIIFLQNVRVPGITIICAAGHYKETQRQAVVEAVINIAVSIGLVFRFGMAGVLIGTVCSYGYRSIEIMIYNGKNLVPGSAAKTVKRLITNTGLLCVLLFVGYQFVPREMDSFIAWIAYATVYGFSAMGLFGIGNVLFEPDEARILVGRLKSLKKE